MNPEIQPQARYILPSFIEHSSWGVKESNPYNKLFEERIIFLGVQVDDASANDIMAQLLVLESLDPDRDITMYINSPGGGFTSLMAIYDTMQYVRADIQTVCLGQAASAAAVLLAAGTPGKRMALPNARVLIHQPSLSGVIQGQFSDLEIQAAEIERMRTLMETTLARHTGKDAGVIRKDTDRDKILTAEEAKDYGIIDTVLEYRKLSADKLISAPNVHSRRIFGRFFSQGCTLGERLRCRRAAPDNIRRRCGLRPLPIAAPVQAKTETVRSKPVHPNARRCWDTQSPVCRFRGPARSPAPRHRARSN